MKTNVIKLDYHGLNVGFTEDGWFNATEAGAKFGKRVADWLENQDTQDYMAALARHLNMPDLAHLIRAKRGRNGGTWLHPKLAVAFGRWLSPDFAAWCDTQLDALLRGTHPHYDWKRTRHAATASFKVMNEALRLVREEQGKMAVSHHYVNEARLVNWAVTGDFRGLDRNALPLHDLDLLAKLETKNAVLISRGVPYADRKKMLVQHALDWRCEHQAMTGRVA
jgi:hypothetical protein